MKLLDAVAQSTQPLVVRRPSGAQWRLTSCCDFSELIRRCPLRYVLNDDLVRLCTELGFAEGDKLASCLDLIHVPAQQLWVEWSEAPQRDELSRTLPECLHGSQGTQRGRAGAYIVADPKGRRGTIRTFWATDRDPTEPMVAAIEIRYDLDGELPEGRGLDAMFDGVPARVSDGLHSPLNDILDLARYQYDDCWAEYYRQTCGTQELRHRVARSSLGTVAYDLPMLLALFLLHFVQIPLRSARYSAARINAKRQRNGKPPLLDCVELSAPVFSRPVTHGKSSAEPGSTPVRRHHVRGHLVRRQNTIYWRSSHWRGHLCLGRVQSRTVTLHAGAH